MTYRSKTKNNRPFTIIKAKDDPYKQLLINLSGSKRDGYYLVFKGNILEVLEMMDEAQELLTKAKNHFITQSN